MRIRNRKRELPRRLEAKTFDSHFLTEIRLSRAGSPEKG